MVCVRHLSKAMQPRAIYRGLGSIDFTAAARSVLLVGEEPPAQDAADEADAPPRVRRVLAQSKNSLAPHGASLLFEIWEGMFTWAGTSPLTANDLAGGRQPQQRRDVAVQHAEVWLSAYLRHGPRPAKEGFEAAAAMDIAARTLKRAKQSLGVHSQKERGIWYWLLPSSQCGPLGPLGPLGILDPLAILPTQQDQVIQQGQQGQDSTPRACLE